MPKRFWLPQRGDSSQGKLATFLLTTTLIASISAIAGLGLRASLGAAASEPVKSEKAVVVPQNVRFTVYPEGIHPAAAIVHKGLISIAIEDLAGTENGVVLERLNGNERAIVGNVKRFEQHWRGRSSVELTPGVYRLRVPDRQIEEAQLTVEP
jgi:hypothetical protein